MIMAQANRITKALIESIVKNAIEKSGINSDLGNINKDRYALAEALRIESLGGKEEAARIESIDAAIKIKLKGLPGGLMPSGEAVLRRDYEMYRCNLGGRRVRMPYTEDREEHRICPSDITLTGDHPLVIEFDRICGAEADIIKRRDDMASQVRASVSQFTTVKKLVEAWPEVIELLPSETATQQTPLPVVQVSDLNSMIGLPSDQK